MYTTAHPAVQTEKKHSGMHQKKATYGEENNNVAGMWKPGLFHRTKMCTFFKQGKCCRGNQCTFAHSEEECVASPDLVKTKMCKTVVDGGICTNPSCGFAHSPAELRTVNRQSDICRESGVRNKKGFKQVQPYQPASTQLQSPLTPGLQIQDAIQEGIHTSSMQASTHTSEAVPRVPRGSPLENTLMIDKQPQAPQTASIKNQNTPHVASPVQPVPKGDAVSMALASLESINQQISDSATIHEERKCLQAQLERVILMLQLSSDRTVVGNSVWSESTKSDLSSDQDDLSECDLSPQTTAVESKNLPASSHRALNEWLCTYSMYGVRTKNTFLDVDAVPQHEKPVRKTRSASPQPRQRD